MASTDPDQAGQADRRAARAQGVLRDLGQQVGRAAPGPRRPTTVSHKSMFLYYNWLVEQALQEHADGPDGPGAARRQRRHVQEPGDQLLPDDHRDPAADRERRPGLHGHADPVRPVPQPSVRPLDPGRLLRLRRVLRPDRPQAGRGLPRDDRLQLGRRRGEPPGRRPASCRPSSSAARSPTSPARTAASSWPSGWPRPRTPGSPPRSPTASGPTSWASASSSRSTTSASATPPPTPSCSRPWASTSPTTKYDLKALVRDICNSRTYQRTTQRNESNASDERNFAHATGPPDQGREPARHDQRGDRDQGQVPGPARSAPGPSRSPTARAVDLLPHHLRPGHPRDRLLVRGQDGADALAGPPPAQRRHRQRQDPAGRRDPEADRRPRSSPRSGSPSSTSAASPASRPRRSSTSSCPRSAQSPNQAQALEDMFWALLNSREFLFNH